MAPGYQTVIDDDTEDPFADSWPASSRGSVRAAHSPEVERWRPLVEKYFPPDAVEAALAVMEKESGGNPSIPSAYNSRGTEDSHGLFQVNIRAHGGTPQQWSDPEANVRYAAQLYKTSGWQPWQNSARALGLSTEPPRGASMTDYNEVPYAGLPTNPWQAPASEDDSAWRRGMLQAARDNAYARYQKDADIPEYADKWLEIMLDYDEQLKQLDAGPKPESRPPQPSVSTSAQKIPWWNAQKQDWEMVPNENYVPGTASRPPQPSVSTTAPYIPKWNAQTNDYDMVLNQNYIPPGPRAPSFQSASASTPGFFDLATGQTRPNPYYADPNSDAAKAVAEAERAWELAEAQRERDAAMQRQRTATAGTVAGIIDSGTQFAIPRLRAPGQTHFPGYEPGGAYQQLMLRAGVRPTNDTGRVVQTNYDPAASWEQARRLLGI